MRRAEKLIVSSPWSLLVLLGLPSLALSATSACLGPGWLRVVGVLAGLGLAAAAWVLGLLFHRSSRRASDDALRANCEGMRELALLQETLAHQIKNPLASIKGIAALIQLEPGRTGERVEVLQQEVERLQRIVEEVLSFSRPLTPLDAETVDLRDVTAAAAELHAGLASRKRIELVVRADGPCEVRCDPRKVKQTLLHVLHNAIDASPEGSPIELVLARLDGRVRLRVLDRGPGVPGALLERIVAPGVTTKPDAAGLGLTIARGLAEQHRGSLTLHNREGGGLMAQIELPVRCPMLAEERLT
jgi:signal transduction histidine kinase